MSVPPIEPPKVPVLSSWKEIAAHLGVSVRTAQVWERERGLPVRRLPGGRLAADPSALAVWRQGGTGGAHRSHRKLWIVVVAAVMLAGVAVTYGVVVHGGVPATWRVQENALVISDGGGRELWRHVFDQPLQAVHY